MGWTDLKKEWQECNQKIKEQGKKAEYLGRNAEDRNSEESLMEEMDEIEEGGDDKY